MAFRLQQWRVLYSPRDRGLLFLLARATTRYDCLNFRGRTLIILAGVYLLSLPKTQGDGEMRVIHFDLDSMVDLSSVRLLLPKDLRAVEGRTAVAKSMKEAFRRFVRRVTLCGCFGFYYCCGLSRAFLLGCLFKNNIEFTKLTLVQWECRVVLTPETGLFLHAWSEFLCNFIVDETRT